MAVFGTLEELPLPEVLSTLSRRTGKLVLSSLPGGLTAEIHISNSYITALYVNKRPYDLVEAHQFFQGLMQKRFGNFEFLKGIPEELTRYFEISVVQVLTGSFALQEISTAESDHFPASQTRFVATNKASHLYLGFELDQFWTQAQPYLLAGANAEQLAKHLNISVLNVQSCLYRLRASGRIMPLRVFQQSMPSSQLGSATMPFPQGVQDTQPGKPQTLTPSSQAVPKPDVPNSSNLLGRLLKALRFRS